MPHVIRLRGPWRYRVLPRTMPGGASNEADRSWTDGTARMPLDLGQLLCDDFHGRVRYTRCFGRPTGLTEHDRVMLVLEQVDADATVVLDASLLGHICAGARHTRFDVSRILNKRNELVVDIEVPVRATNSPCPPTLGKPGQVIKEVRIEIFSADEGVRHEG